MNRRNILLCVAGGTPAIITETLWALKQRGESIHEIRVITTLEGRDKILTGRIGGRGAADESLLDRDHGQFFKFLRDYPEAGHIKFDETSLYILTNKQTAVPSPRDSDRDRLTDILTDEDNEKTANQICEIVRELAADEAVQIHASIAGGRKTMSLFLMTAMQLFGKHDDKMSHVLVSKEVEFGAPKFFYKPPTPVPILDPTGKPRTKVDGSVLTTDDVNIYLADIQFIRLRGVGARSLDKPVVSYAEFVREAQSELKFLESARELRVIPKTRTIKVGTREAKLELRRMFVYALFAYYRKNRIGEDGYVGLDEITVGDLATTCRLFVEVEEEESAIDAFRSTLKRANFIDKFIRGEVKEKLLDEKRKNDRKHRLQSAIEASVTSEEVNEQVLSSFRQALGRITESLVEAKIDSRFDIERKGSKGSYIFGLSVEPERIRFE